LKNKLKFEDFIEIIDAEINKYRNKWFIAESCAIDFEDVSQIIRIHIFKKWHLFDESKKIEPWLNAIISNQIKNLIRNNYGNYSKPCNKCGAAKGNDGCEIYSIQCSGCPLYARWEKTKRHGFNLRKCQSIEENIDRVHAQEEYSSILEKNIEKLNELLPSILKENEHKFYKLYFVDRCSDNEIALKMKFKTCEINRKPGYKQMQNIKKSIIKKIKKALQEDKFDLI
jgi:RNA polymerase sigma factor (sigma-70 family)